MSTSFETQVPALLDAANDAMVDLRHDFHRYPELSLDEHRTSATISDRLRALDWHIEPCPTPTGAVATLDTGRPGATVMIRADIDALPVTEERAVSFRSANDGVMHACGHDVHTAALLGVADLLAQRRDQLSGKYVALFQPAEEALGGALAMIKGGVLENNNVDYVIGAHVTSILPVGLVGTRPGVIMSEADGYTITIHGKGGHGAMASVEGNVVLAVSQLAQRLGEVIVGLSFDGTACACSAGVIAAGTANNVVPRLATLKGTLRTFSDDQRRDALGRLHALLQDIDEEFHVHSDLALNLNAPRVTNDADVTSVVQESARQFLGAPSVITMPPVSPSDDVSEFMNRVPGCYLFAGGALADGSSGMHHSPDFAVDDGSLRVIAGVLASAAVALAGVARAPGTS